MNTARDWIGVLALVLLGLALVALGIEGRKEIRRRRALRGGGGLPVRPARGAPAAPALRLVVTMPREAPAPPPRPVRWTCPERLGDEAQACSLCRARAGRPCDREAAEHARERRAVRAQALEVVRQIALRSEPEIPVPEASQVRALEPARESEPEDELTTIDVRRPAVRLPVVRAPLLEALQRVENEQGVDPSERRTVELPQARARGGR